MFLWPLLCPHTNPRAAEKKKSWNLIMWDVTEICLHIPNLADVGQQCPTLSKDLRVYMLCTGHLECNLPHICQRH
jgi:hypothetical protein